jgi:hypothetical protein
MSKMRLFYIRIKETFIMALTTKNTREGNDKNGK